MQLKRSDREVKHLDQSLQFHDEIILRFRQGRLQEVIIDGIRQNDVKVFSIAASPTQVASYLIEHSTVYSDS